MILVVLVDFTESENPSLSRLKYKIPQFFQDSGIPFQEENVYLQSVARRLSEKSIKTLAEHVKEILLWRVGIGKDLADFSDNDFDYYVDAQCSYVRKSGYGLSWNTVNSRAAGAHRFLVWCRINGYSPNITLEVAKSTGLGAKVSYKIKGHPSRRLEEPTKFLLLDSAINFIIAVSAISAASPRISSRNCLIAKLMLQCGLRLSEAVAFPIMDLPEINNRGHSTPARIVGKGEKPRVILIPNRLLTDLWAYADMERLSILEKLHGIGLGLPHVHRLFISNRGKGITGNWIEKIFVRAGNSIGIKAVPHALRHTFGTYHYLFNKDLLFLAGLMGHESMLTTEKFYVHTARLISHTGDYEEFQLKIDRICAQVQL
jgi:integrase/recombinase XerD